MLLLQHQERVLLPGFEDILLIVFRTDGKDDAALAQLHKCLLEVKEGLPRIVTTNLDAVDAILAEHAAPEGVVKVEHKAFLALQGYAFHLTSEPSLERLVQRRIQSHL